MHLTAVSLQQQSFLTLNLLHIWIRIIHIVYKATGKIHLKILTEILKDICIVGIIQFTQHIVTMEREDSGIADLHNQVRAYFLPPVAIASEGS